MKTAAVVILYHPEQEQVLKNVSSYISYVDIVFIIANSPCSTSFKARLRDISNKVLILQNEANEGIARPLNAAVKAAKGRYDWLLCMDQDSFFEKQEIHLYFKNFEDIFYFRDGVAIVGLSHSKPNSCNQNKSFACEVLTVITSGSLINLNICDKLGGFDEKLFIDEVDHEYCYRAILAGYKVVKFPNIHLNHQLGLEKQAGYFVIFNKSRRSIHSPVRIYYMVRNYLYVSAIYQKLLPEEFKKRRKGLIVILKNNFLFSGKFFQVLVAAIKGYLHFKMKKFSA